MTTFIVFKLNERRGFFLMRNSMELLFFVFGCLLAVAVSSEHVVLSKYYHPIRYDLLIKAPFNVETQPGGYSGSVEIEFKCAHETNRVVLSVLDLEIGRVAMFYGNREIGVRSVSVNVGNQQMWIELVESIKGDRVYKVSVEFTSLFKNDKMGLYWGSYEANNGARRWYVASQVSRSLARKAFPCFDEASLRAKFKLRVQHYVSTSVLSNARDSVKRKLENNLVETEFEETNLPISTYQFAVVISDFVCKSDERSSDVRVCSRPNAVDKFEIFHTAAVKSKEVFEAILKTKFPLSKLDHVALPETLYAIEDNLGLPMYRESVVFHDSLHPRAFIEQEIFKNVALQTSIMWLESMAPTTSWNDFWLNAGLSHLLAYVGADKINPDFKYCEQFFRYVFQALEFDSDGSMNAIAHEHEKRNPNDDFKIHLKSAAILRMLMSVVGEDNFFDGIKEYLKEGKVSNASRLWQAMQKTSTMDVGEMMNKWINQEGYPCLTMIKVSRNQIKVKQQRFLVDESIDRQQLWSIPLNYSIQRVGKLSNSSSFTWINEENHLVILQQPLEENDFILDNVHVSGGFYRVNYEPDNWRKIIKQLKSNTHAISALNRASLIEDSFNLAKAGLLDWQLVLDLVEYLENEDEMIAWVPGIYHLRNILDSIDDKTIRIKYEKKLQALLKPIFQAVYRKKNETKLDTLLRNQVINFACYVNLEDCINATNLLGTRFGFSSMPADLRQIVYCSAVKHGSESEFRSTFNAYKNISESGNKQMLLDLQAALSCTLNEKLLEEFLNYVLMNSKKEDVVRVVSYSLSHHGVTGTWNYVQKNIKSIFKKFENNEAKVRGLVSLLSTKLKKEHLLKFQELFQGQEAAVKKIELNTKSSLKLSDSVRRWLKL